MNDRQLTPLDRWLDQADRALRSTLASPRADRPNPAGDQPDPVATEQDRRHAAGLMRINHSGEVAAQGLYHGQALTAREPSLRDAMLKAAREEGDHLAWCSERLAELHARPSILNPFWYAGSVAIGALAGALGDRWSLGFMAETEHQVEGHLEDHLGRLPHGDSRSRAILEQMKDDEVAHARAALDAGGAELPLPIRGLMKLTSRVMTKTAYWV